MKGFRASDIVAREEQPAKLRAELPGILNWALRGCLEWQKYGLITPAAITAAVEDYRSSMDTIGDFLEDRCLLAQNAQCTKAELYASHGDWCASSGEFKVAKKAFSQALLERGFKDDRSMKSRFWLGIAIQQTGGVSKTGGMEDFDT